MSKASRVLALISAVLTAVALFALRPHGEPGTVMRDFEAYYAAGSTWLAHANAYGLDIWYVESRIPGVIAAHYEVLPFVGLPGTLPFWSLFSNLPYPDAAREWAVLLGLSLAALIVATARILALPRINAIVVALAALAFVPITSGFGLGQAALPAYAATVLTLALPILIAPLAIVVASLQPNVALGLLVLFSTRKTALIAVAGGVLAAILGFIAAGAAWPMQYLSALAAHAAAERFAAIQYTPAAVMYGFHAAPAVAGALGAIVALIAVVFAVAGVWRARTLVHRFAIACTAVPFVAGFFHEHDFVVLFVPVLFAVLNTKRPALASLGAVLAGVNWLDFAQQPQGAWQDIALAFALLAAVAALRPARAHLWTAGILTGLLALGAWLGATHHLPIWPNDMAAIARGATIAEVWKNEQLQTGLLRPDAAAALLRTLALLGSALLLYLVLDVDVHHVVERRDRIGMEVL